MPKITKECPVCTKTFEVDASRLKHGRGKTCSYNCGRVLAVQLMTNRIEVNCENCGKAIQRTPSQVRGRVFCSRACRKTQKQVNCPVCGKEFLSRGDAQYCSKPCAHKSPERSKKLAESAHKSWQDPDISARLLEGIKRRSESEEWRSAAHFQTGENHPRFAGKERQRKESYAVKKWRKSVFDRDNHTCQHCGATDQKLHAHHIKPWGEYPELRFNLENGLSLCHACHAAIHGRTPKHFNKHCQSCGIKKTDARSPLCRACWYEKRRNQTRSPNNLVNSHPQLGH